jgi:hypothetical protein
LCSDGNCIGIIGADGRCKECGRAYEGQLPNPGEDGGAPEDEGLPTESSLTDEENPVIESPEVDSEEPEGDWADRTLCIDGNCIGVVGPDGCCKTCGKPHPGSNS